MSGLIYLGFFQTEGTAEGLKIYIGNKDNTILQDLWILDDSVENDEFLWKEGRVEIKGAELSNDPVYRVST